MSSVPAWQSGFWSNTQRLIPWKDILRRCMLQIGDRPDLTETEYNRKVAAMFFGELPATDQLFEAVIKKGDLDYAKKLFVAFFQLPPAEVPAPDTIARQTRTAKDELRNEGRLIRKSEDGQDESFSTLLTQAEEEAGHYNSSIEARFKLRLKEQFPQYRWEENKTLRVQTGIHQERMIQPDILCEELCLSIEIDGWEFHNGRDQFISDRQKARIMQSLGYYHLQFSGPELSIQGGFSNAIREIEAFIEKRCQKESTQ